MAEEEQKIIQKSVSKTILLLLTCIWLCIYIYGKAFMEGLAPEIYIPNLYIKSNNSEPPILRLFPNQHNDGTTPVHFENKLEKMHEYYLDYGPHVKQLVFIMVDALRFDMATPVNTLNSQIFQSKLGTFMHFIGKRNGQADARKLITEGPNDTFLKVKTLVSGAACTFAGFLDLFVSRSVRNNNIFYVLKLS